MTWRVYWSDGGSKTYISSTWICPDTVKLGELDWTLRADNTGLGHRKVTS
jgi:hypothetical protein